MANAGDLKKMRGRKKIKPVIICIEVAFNYICNLVARTKCNQI